ncbi:MAG TPA: peptidase M13 [Pseudoclavibacter sp.]|nr:peptidase M13 [Pseudoclavibacter sp.]
MTRASGITISTLDPATRPQDDLYRHVNGTWLAHTTIPEDRARYGAFLMLAEASEKAVHQIIEDAATAQEPSENERKIGALYASFMDEEAIEARGVTPIAADLERVMSVETLDEFVQVAGQSWRYGAGGFVGLFVNGDFADPDKTVAFMMQAGIGLPDESYYREDSFAQVREQYVAHIERIFELAGVPEAASGARLAFDLETEIASHHWDVVASRDWERMYNVRSFAQLQELTPGFDWGAYLAAADIPEEKLAELVVTQEDAIQATLNLVDVAHLPAWRYWLALRIINASAPLLSRAFVQENFAFYGTVLSGTPTLRPRWKRGVSLVESAMGEAVGELYVQRHFPAEAKRRMDDLVANLLGAYRESIQTLSWMSDETKTRALDKLGQFTPKIGYPVRWRDYTELEVDATDVIANSRAIAEFQQRIELDKLGKPVDRDEWAMTPQTVNAYYNPSLNEIVFPAAILQPPFFQVDADDAANYGAIGAVIGHEIGHGFDDNGSKFDGTGAMVNWWTDADREAFENLTKKLIAQYDALEPAEAPGHHVNGALTIGENIGDLGGLGIAWKAYLASQEGAELPVLDGLSAAERFFLSWAAVWAEKRRPEEALRLLSIDPHSPNEFRCNQIARNLDVFHAAFGTRPGDGLWLDPDQRVTVW